MQQHRSEREFLQELEKRAKVEHKLLETEVMPAWAKRLGDWLVVDPWRVIVPLAGVTYYALRITLGTGFREFVLGLFGGFV